MKFIKGRWFPLIVATLLIAIGGGAMYLFGWRVTYLPELENSWDAVSAVAAWGGVIVAIASTTASFLAVWFAIQVPKKIAEQQNKIALFEKRYQVYTSTMKIVQVANKILLSKSDDVNGAKNYFDHFSSSRRNFSMNIYAQNIIQEQQRIIDIATEDVEKVPLLFSNISKDSIELIQKVIILLTMVVLQDTAPSKLENSVSHEDWKKIQVVLDGMQRQLYLG